MSQLKTYFTSRGEVLCVQLEDELHRRKLERGFVPSGFRAPHANFFRLPFLIFPRSLFIKLLCFHAVYLLKSHQFSIHRESR